MVEIFTKNDIDKISLDILKKSKSYGVFPTPVDEIIKYSELRFDDKVDLSKPDESFLSRFSEATKGTFINALRQVRGYIDRREKVIILDLSQGESRRNFVKLHEVGHDILPWQKATFEHIDDDSTLDPETIEEFEAEANYFASVTLFQHDRFEKEVSKLELGIKAPMHLSQLFGASVHATLRKYVECSKNRCALLVLENVSANGTTPFCFKKDFFASAKFIDTFGEIDLPDKFGYKWNFCKDYYFRKKYHEKGEINLNTENGHADFFYHFFSNGFNAFVFLFPYGESKYVKTKIIVKSNLSSEI